MVGRALHVAIGFIAGASLWTACGGASTSPTTGGTGRIVANGSGAAVAGAVLTVPGRSITASASGQFELEPSTAPVPVTITAPGFLTRQTYVSGTASGVTIDLIVAAAPFSLDFYRDFARGAWQCIQQGTAGCPQPLRRWQSAPNIFLKSTDQLGTPVPGDAIAAIRDDVTRLVPLFSGGMYQAGAFETGPVLVGRTGWISIEVLSVNGSTASIGDAGTAGGVHIQLYGFNPVPVTDEFGGGCPRYGGVNHHIIAHEFGHAMGFRHTRNALGVMNTVGELSAGACNAEPGADERFHAAIVYSRPPGNTDVDVDPPGFSISSQR
jgi:Dual-action HEIGH metallo-peptidase